VSELIVDDVGGGAAGAVLMALGELPLGVVAVEDVLVVGNGVALGSGVLLVSAGGDVARGGGQGKSALADNVRNCASASSREPAGITP